MTEVRVYDATTTRFDRAHHRATGEYKVSNTETNRVQIEMDEDADDPDNVWVNEFVHREWTFVAVLASA
jgi:hypothetical protein